MVEDGKGEEGRGVVVEERGVERGKAFFLLNKKDG